MFWALPQSSLFLVPPRPFSAPPPPLQGPRLLQSLPLSSKREANISVLTVLYVNEPSAWGPHKTAGSPVPCIQQELHLRVWTLSGLLVEERAPEEWPSAPLAP